MYHYIHNNQTLDNHRGQLPSHDFVHLKKDLDSYSFADRYEYYKYEESVFLTLRSHKEDVRP